MLPSSGYFKNIMCPFFKVGLCCRPHCHYKHIKPEPPERLFPTIVVENEPLLDTDSSSEYLELLQSNSKSEATREKTQPVATYIPTPVDKIAKLGGILKDNSKNLDKTSVPEYKPTPIAKLRDLNATHINQNFSNEYSSGQVRRKKKVEEYDPTEVKCASRKRVTFAIETESGEIDHIIPDPDVITLESDSDDNINGDVPQFSDDESDEIPSVVIKVEAEEPSECFDEKLEKEKDSDSSEISVFSLVDKIIVDSKKNEQLLKSFKAPVRTIAIEKNFPPSVKRLGGNKKFCDKTTKSSLNEKAEHIHSGFDKLKGSNSGTKSTIKEAEKYDSFTDKVKMENTLSSVSTNNLPSETKIKKSSSDSKKSSSSGSKSSKERSKHSDKSSTSKHGEDSLAKDKKHSKNRSSDKKSSKGKCDKVPSKLKSTMEKTDKRQTEESKIQDGVVSSSSVTAKKKLEKSHKTALSSEVKSEKSKPHKRSSESKHKSSPEAKNKKLKTDSSSDTQVKSKVSSEIKHKKTKTTSAILDIDPLKNKFPAKDKNGLCDNDSDSGAVDELVSLSSDSDRDEEECWKIYNESYPNSTQCSFSEPSKDSSSTKKPEIVILGKKRVAHQGTEALKKPKPNAVLSEAKKLNPVQVMHNRYAKLQAMYARQNEERALAINGKPNIPNAQRKIFAMPNSSLIEAVNQKNELSRPITSSRDLSEPSRTPVTTIKGAKRVAHVPLVALKPRPIIPTEFGSRVPTNVRQKFLNSFINEYLKSCSTEDQAYEKALDEEKRAYERSTSKAIYMNVASNAISRLRHRTDVDTQLDASSSSIVSSTSTSSIKPQGKTISHESILVGPRAGKASFSIERKKQKKVDVNLRGSALYSYLLSYALTPEQLVENGFPLMHPSESGKAVISGYRKLNWCNDAFKRTCTRCAKVYYVNTEENYVKDEECDFHWGHLWKRRIAGAIESRYSCCQGDSESEGCCVGAGHVFEGSENHALKGFVKTLPKTPPPDKYYGVYALDCEMCYTTAGIELTRITVIDPELKPVFESFVKPQNKVLDYNTRFSGITEDDLKNVKTSLRDIQAVLLCIFNDKTILIGHSLESDFKALKMFHKTVVDTSVVFPHKIGLPFKRSLKTLMAEKLNKIIQNSIGGHDSSEDALACMELMIWKIKEDLKRSR